MNPGTVLGQSIAICISASALAILDLPAATLMICLAGPAWAMVLNRSYARMLGDQARTTRRSEGDHAIARQLAISYLTPALIAVVALATGEGVRPSIGVISPADLQVFLTIISITLLSWLASSHIDWYYIRPRVDGVVVPPPCQTSRDTMWKGVTRKWYLHRAIASVVTGGAVVALALLVAITLGEQWPKALAELGGFAAIFGLGAFLLKDEWQNLSPTIQGIREPLYWLGDDLRYETDKWKVRGFVLHVSIPLTKLVPLDFRHWGDHDGEADHRVGIPARGSPPSIEGIATLWLGRGGQGLESRVCLLRRQGRAWAEAPDHPLDPRGR